MMRSANFAGLLLIVAATTVATGSVRGQTTFKLAGIGGATMLPDDRTFVVSVPAEAVLIYFDTVEDKELRRVELEFQPASLAAQGDMLIAATKGSSVVHILDAQSGKERSEVKLSGEPVRALACLQTGGLVYAANMNNKIFAIDVKSGEATETEGKGQYLAVEPKDGKFLYAGTQGAIKDTLLIQRGPGGSARVSLNKSNDRASLMKYAIEGRALKAVAVNTNAARNGLGIAVSADGKRVAMAGGGGWMSMTDPHCFYVVAIWDAADMESQLGQVETGPYPVGIGFHPKENWGAAFHEGQPSELIIFNSKSLVNKATYKVPNAHSVETAYIGFGGNGTKAIFASLIGVHNKNEGIVMFAPLDKSKAKSEADTAGTPKKKSSRSKTP
jgi:glutamine cyclotransferase